MEMDGKYVIGVSDPTCMDGEIQLTFENINAAEVIESNERVTVINLNPLTITINTKGAERANIELTVSVNG